MTVSLHSRSGKFLARARGSCCPGRHGPPGGPLPHPSFPPQDRELKQADNRPEFSSVRASERTVFRLIPAIEEILAIEFAIPSVMGFERPANTLQLGVQLFG